MAAQSNIPITREGGNLTGREETRNAGRFIRPAVDIWETEEGLKLVADIPGVTKDGLNVDIDQGILTIEGKTGENRQGEAIFREFDLVSYYRQFQLPGEVDTEKIAAELKNGVLVLQLPKLEAAKPRRIEITTH
ncbi:MAG: Hsp20/alpha crystallin family protein [Desulfuromonadales bacterium]